ncbi:ArgP/LysG family DNA-binding transcriptional regulator [Duganella violaceipulchra]|uniref:ArgP/LysG family DNA-binding transcriptional regulator n=1 Tax=Duganella violaceipulchra TaxID=2849652 RepID=A0AA41KZN2_9BURK|nr:ArgP/LysG family DNA-binding transcriptional regulator [Duganella violaceicalia]MBV6320891.1 ArgP/LysG family DNA-binding transcriptional regulator [Duganella violaceicalia]MCP2008398.1 LysR family transcriptional regulator (chromosome initiation inhibitor) [Duganella violaceicalia]
MGSLDYRALAVLDAVASQGSFEKAALALGISQSAVSQRIKALEDAAGRLLIVRGQPAVPTGLGQRLVSHHRNVRLMEASLDIDLGHKVSMPEIALAVDAASLATWFPMSLQPLLSPPRCQLKVQLADQRMALHLVQEGSVFGSIAVAQEHPDQHANGPDVTPLGKMRYVCVATPAFAGHWFGDGFSLEAARLAPAVVSDQDMMSGFLHTVLELNGPYPHHTMPQSAATAECIHGSLAYGLMPLIQVSGALASDRLVDLAPGHHIDVALNWHAWNLDTPFTRALTEQIVATAQRFLL